MKSGDVGPEGGADGGKLPEWAPRVRKAQIWRLYEDDAGGIHDEDLLDEVGYALLARCESFITANLARARGGELPCPECGQTVKREEALHCECGWTLTWKAYFRTIQHKQLSGAEPVLTQFREFVGAFPVAKSSREKMLLIDRLIHGFHWSLRMERPTRPVAVNLIQGKMNEVVAFLDSLTYGEGGAPEMGEALEEWSRNIDANREWYRRRRKV